MRVVDTVLKEKVVTVKQLERDQNNSLKVNSTRPE